MIIIDVSAIAAHPVECWIQYCVIRNVAGLNLGLYAIILSVPVVLYLEKTSHNSYELSEAHDLIFAEIC